jgi:hypothetical protein
LTGIIEMRFTAGENLEFRLSARGIDFFVDDRIAREDDLGLRSTLGSKGFDLIDSGALCVPCP